MSASVFLTMQQAVAVSGLPYAVLAAGVKSGELEALRLGRGQRPARIYIRRDHLAGFLRRRTGLDAQSREALRNLAAALIRINSAEKGVRP